MPSDDPQRAARLTDPIGHGPGILGMMGGMLVGAVVGAALIAAAPVGAVAAVAMATFAAVGCVAGGGLSGGQLVRGFQKACGLPDPQTGLLGPVASINVRIGKLFAARVMDTSIVCDGLKSCAHFPLPMVPIAEGARTVRINGRPAARVTSKLACGAAIKDGEPTVQIGGPTERVLDVDDPEEELGAVLEGLMLASLAGVVLLNPATLIPILAFGELHAGVGNMADMIWGKDSGARDIAQGLLGFAALGWIARGARSSKGLPKDPNDLLRRGYNETSHPKAAAAGHRTFENPKTGDKLRFDQGKPGEPGWEGKDHYHRTNPNATGKGDAYLDNDGNPVPRGSNASHLPPTD